MIFHLGERFVVLWRTDSEVDGPRIPIRLGPSVAFGSGEHETTGSCVEELEALKLQGARVLDLGCGTGILAIAACKLGAASATAVDNDSRAVEATAGNAALNHLEDKLTGVLGTLEDVRDERFDLIVANLYGDIVLSHVDAFAEMLLPGGHLLLSGIQLEYAFDIKEALKKLGLERLKYRILDEYATLVYRLDAGDPRETS